MFTCDLFMSTRETRISCRELSSGAVTICFMTWVLGFVHTTFRLRDQRSNPLYLIFIRCAIVNESLFYLSACPLNYYGNDCSFTCTLLKNRYRCKAGQRVMQRELRHRNSLIFKVRYYFMHELILIYRMVCLLWVFVPLENFFY